MTVISWYVRLQYRKDENDVTFTTNVSDAADVMTAIGKAQEKALIMFLLKSEDCVEVDVEPAVEAG